MPRIRSKGEAIGIRLEIHIDDVFQTICYQRNIAPRDMAIKILTDWVVAQTKTSPSAAASMAAGEQNVAPAEALAKEFFP